MIHYLVCALNARHYIMKGQLEIAYLPKFANMYIMLIVLVIVITKIL